MKGKIIINVTKCDLKILAKLFLSILFLNFLDYQKMRNGTDLEKTWWAHDVDATSLRRIDVSTTSFDVMCLLEI